MSSVLFMDTPLATEWAQRNGAEGIRLAPITGDDRSYLDGTMTEFDEVLDYTTRQTSSRDNAWEAEGKAAQAESNLIAAACWPGARGERAEQRLRELGYTINGEFDEYRRHNQEFLNQNHEDHE